jgi:hypothetical protein
MPFPPKNNCPTLTHMFHMVVALMIQCFINYLPSNSPVDYRVCLSNFNATNSLLIDIAQVTKYSPLFTSTRAKSKAIYQSCTIDYNISSIVDNRKVGIMFSLSLFSRLLHVKLSLVIEDKSVFSQMSIHREVKLN